MLQWSVPPLSWGMSGAWVTPLARHPARWVMYPSVCTARIASNICTARIAIITEVHYRAGCMTWLACGGHHHWSPLPSRMYDVVGLWGTHACRVSIRAHETYIVINLVLGPVSLLRFFHRNSNTGEILFHSHLDSNTMIATKFCTWHDSSACRVMCKKLLRYDGQQRNNTKAKFPSNLNCGQKNR